MKILSVWNFLNIRMITKVVLGVVLFLLSNFFISSSQIVNNSLSENDNDKTSSTTQLSNLSDFTSSSSPTTMTTPSNSSVSEEMISASSSLIMTQTTIPVITTTAKAVSSTTSHIDENSESITKSVQNPNNTIKIILSLANDNETTIPTTTTMSTIKLKSTTVAFQVPEDCSDYKVSQTHSVWFH